MGAERDTGLVTSVDAVKKTRVRLSPERRGEILSAAASTVVTLGYEATTIEAIAAAAGASKATLYRHWNDKATLVVTAFTEQSGIRLDAIDTGAMVGDLRQLMQMLANHAPANIALLLTLSDAAHRDPRLAAAVTDVFSPHLAELTTILVRAEERGEITAARAARIMPLMVGALFAPAMTGADSAVVTEEYLLRYLDDVILPFLSSNG